MGKNYLMVSLDDKRIDILANILSNKTSKKIIELLSNREATESEIAQFLRLPANTVNYNVRKLVESGIVEKSGSFFWSVKGKKVVKYRLANKKIIISPKNYVDDKLLISAGVILILAFLLKFIADYLNYVGDISSGVTETIYFKSNFYESSQNIGSISNIKFVISSLLPFNFWIWFLIGGILALVIYSLLNWLNWRRT